MRAFNTRAQGPSLDPGPGPRLLQVNFHRVHPRCPIQIIISITAHSHVLYSSLCRSSMFRSQMPYSTDRGNSLPSLPSFPFILSSLKLLSTLHSPSLGILYLTLTNSLIHKASPLLCFAVHHHHQGSLQLTLFHLGKPFPFPFYFQIFLSLSIFMFIHTHTTTSISHSLILLMHTLRLLLTLRFHSRTHSDPHSQSFLQILPPYRAELSPITISTVVRHAPCR